MPFLQKKVESPRYVPSLSLDGHIIKPGALFCKAAFVSTFVHKIQVLDHWCAEIGRDTGEIERACDTCSFASSKMRDDYVKAGAAHFMLGMSGTWDYDAVEDLVRWRDQRNSA